MVSPLAVIDRVDNFTYGSTDNCYLLVAHTDNVALGYIHPTLVDHLRAHPGFTSSGRSISINASYDTLEKRNQLFEQFALELKSKPELHQLVAKGWRNELYTVYNPTHTPYFQVERAVSVLLGVVTYGVHINGYIPENKSSNGKLKFWIPRRSATKPTFPSMLDNTVAGGLGYPHGIWETVVKECDEEAGLPQKFVEENAKSTGVLTYIYQTPDGGIQPEVEYIYDIVFPNETEVIPVPQDGEAQDFTLMDIDEVEQRLQADEFKPNCGMVIIDFLIRHGYITPENEQFYSEILARTHRRLPFPTK
ncbi:uncharacterized protein CANTADRAFT_169807 [Suhomyces tanzawaensis NRRL Y-17324]|uniref:Nudix hydrolase domain-containing protein n=1 Tax=Suhomyces tanzawaensis NRRL Y-17324 TaxID=984487 RepID=A0A1E4SMG1_9ASCO|nr:uncharacterized protein CANTADRAFT_169807 [Suhomyces tanzawaensis NRRL Y-17324]ODV80700.1 hypothetical protein CANTADRAFT_169807 [Suhomyces tanzawaensis NRRL Y-17324]